MGLLVDGVWQDRWYDTEKSGGRFVRQASAFRDWITNDGSSRFSADAGRYHLYVSLACPWAHRTLIFRRLKSLESLISLSIVDPKMGAEGWCFSDVPGALPDTENGAEFLHQVYTRARADYTGRVTVPVLWDKQEKTIVNNESAEIIRMLNSAFDGQASVAAADYYPAQLRDAIDALNLRIYDRVNNGVYRAGFATTQRAYDEAVVALFAMLDELEKTLDRQRYLAGDRLTEADWRLFTTLLRFDPVYYGHFKCNLRQIADYSNLSNYTRELFQIPGVSDTVNMDHIKQHYYWSHTTINPHRIVPKGPTLSYEAHHNRDRLPRAAL